MVLNFRNKRVLPALAILAAVPFLWFGTLGLLQHMGDMGHSGSIGGCLFDGPTELCNMNFSEHISLWEGAISGLAQNSAGAIMLLLSLISILLISYWRHSLFEFFDRIGSRFKIFGENYSFINIVKVLQEAFSGGILNSKIYAPTA